MTAKRLIAIAVCGLLISCSGGSQDAEGEEQSGAVELAPDVAFLMEQLEATHPDLYHRHAKDEWLTEAARLSETVRKGDETEVILGYCRLVSLADDDQTQVIPPSHAVINQRWLPLIFHRYADGWYVRAAQNEYVPVMGLRLLEIGGMPVNTLVGYLRPLVSADNGVGALVPIAHLMRNASVLESIGVPVHAPDSLPVAYTDANGTRRERWIQYVGDTAIAEGWRDAATTPLLRHALYLSLEGSYADQYMPQDRMLYVKFATTPAADTTEVAAFFKRVFVFADSASIYRLAIDIRNNHSASRSLNEPLLNGLITSDSLNVPGKVFVIIGRETCAAGMALAAALESHTPAVFVGEPTGGSPNQFGDPKPIVLPESGITVECSSERWQDSAPDDARPWITPDITAQELWGDFFHGVDPALQVARMIDYNHLKRMFPSDSTAAGDAMYKSRWQRPNQLQVEKWPELLGR